MATARLKLGDIIEAKLQTQDKVLRVTLCTRETLCFGQELVDAGTWVKADTGELPGEVGDGEIVR